MVMILIGVIWALRVVDLSFKRGAAGSRTSHINLVALKHETKSLFMHQFERFGDGSDLKQLALYDSCHKTY